MQGEPEVRKEQSKSPDEKAEGTNVIEFYVPEGHVKPTRWIPESLRGQIIEFPAPLKKPA